MAETDDYAWPEILHMASFLSGAVASELADEAERALEVLYQAVGATHLGDGDTSPQG